MFSYANKNSCISACSNSYECSERIDQRTTIGSLFAKLSAQWFVLHVQQYDAASSGLHRYLDGSPDWVKNITQGFPRDAVLLVRACAASTGT